MAKLLDGSSLFTTINSGLTNTYSVLSAQYKDGVSLENLIKNESTTALASNGINQNFKSYMQSNFSSIDKNNDGIISAEELNTYSSTLLKQGLTMEQLTQLFATNGVSSSLLDTVMSHFNEIDKNKDGKVTNEEIQAYGIDASVEKQKKADRSNMLKQMSTFYDTSVNKDDSSLLDYRLYDEDDNEEV